jgi:hypothetical protein
MSLIKRGSVLSVDGNTVCRYFNILYDVEIAMDITESTKEIKI